MIKKIKKSGFSLVELLVVISIIGIVSVVAAISLSRAQKDGRDQRRIDDLKAIQNAAEQMMLLSGTYPTSVNFYKTTSPAWSVGSQIVLAKVPGDPKGNTNYLASGISATGYCVCASIENVRNSNAENSSCSFANRTSYFCVQNQQ
jgi:prepilin-type N-terminal cleavage/methylation domain-containing protein